MDVIEAKRRIELHMMNHHMEESSHYKYLAKALQMAINALGSIDQIRWERDVAVKQLKELGIGFAEQVDGKYLSKEEYEKLLEYKYMYENLCK